MRAKWLILLKVQLTGLLGINKAKHSDDARVKRRTEEVRGDESLESVFLEVLESDAR